MLALVEPIKSPKPIQGWHEGGTQSCAHWLNWKIGLSLNAAREKLRVAHSLEIMPKVSKAFSEGKLSYSKVRAISRLVNEKSDEYLLMIAEHGTASQLEKLIRLTRRCASFNQPEPEVIRKVSSYQDEDGMWVINARLPAESGELVVKAIEAIFEQMNTEDVSAETSETDDSVDDSTYEMKRADALCQMAEHYLATAKNEEGIQSLAGHERHQLHVHVDFDSLGRNKGANTSGQVAPRVARRLACDTSLRIVNKDKSGKVLNIGRRSRLVPSNLRRALEIRDSQCVHPSCCATKYLDAHHVKHWVDGGETSLDNLVLLCRKHHTALHNGEFDISMDDGVPRFINTSASHNQNYQCDCAIHTNVKPLPDVSAETSVSKWAGERMDYQLAVGHLLDYI